MQVIINLILAISLMVSAVAFEVYNLPQVAGSFITITLHYVVLVAITYAAFEKFTLSLKLLAGVV